MQRQGQVLVLLRDEGNGAVFVQAARRHVQNVLQAAKYHQFLRTVRHDDGTEGQFNLRGRLLFQGWWFVVKLVVIKTSLVQIGTVLT